MSIYKKLLNSDIASVPFNANKKYSFTSYIENHIGRYDGKSADRAAMEIKKLFKNITDTKS